MRNPERINQLLSNLEQVWKKYPDLRFGQLIDFIKSQCPEDRKNTDPFYWEDDFWDELIRSHI